MNYFVHPGIDPYIIKFGEIGVTYYSLSYVIGILLGWSYANYVVSKTNSAVSKQNLENYITWMILGIVIGGRLGYVLFYDPIKYFANPIEIIQTYKGGMSFHGGILGVIIGSFIFSKINKIKFLELTDILAQGTPIGLFCGRIANFINAELYGHPTQMPWAVVFPHAGFIPRHPSQLYEALLEGVILFFILRYLSFNLNLNKRIGFISGAFLILYALFRSFVEFFRIPDYYAFGFTSGQLLSLPMIIFGIAIIIQSHGYRKTSAK